MTIQAKQIIIHGRVQGVGFRYFVQDVALGYGLVGNVRNRPDRSVEIVVEGDERILPAFLEEVARGPALARVDRVQVNDMAPGGQPKRFQIEGR